MTGIPKPSLLPPIAPRHFGRKCLVLDLDDTLIHSSQEFAERGSFVVFFMGTTMWVIKRPGVDNFLKQMGEIYEIVVFTASPSDYANPVLDMLDAHHVIAHRLFRDSCHDPGWGDYYVKDLSQLGRPMEDIIILDDTPEHYKFQPHNAVPVSKFLTNMDDDELARLTPLFVGLTTVPDVRKILSLLELSRLGEDSMDISLLPCLKALGLVESVKAIVHKAAQRIESR